MSRPSATAAWTSGCEVEQAERVRDGRARLADALGDVLLGEPELVDQLAVGQRLVDRVEVRALQVLDERDLELVAVGELADERRDPLEAGEAGRTHAPLAGDELVAVERLGHEDRLEHAVLADARRELLEHGVVEPVARLVRVRADARERHLDDRRRGWSARCGISEDEAAAERRGVAIGPDRHAPIPASWVDVRASGVAARSVSLADLGMPVSGCGHGRRPRTSIASSR